MSLAPELRKYFRAGIYGEDGKNPINGWDEYYYRDLATGCIMCAFRRGENGPFLSQIMLLPQFAELDGDERIIAVGQSVINGTEYVYIDDGQKVQAVVDGEVPA